MLFIFSEQETVLHTVSNCQIPTGKDKAQSAYFEKYAQRSSSSWLNFPLQKEKRLTTTTN